MHFFGSKISSSCIFLGLQYEAQSDPSLSCILRVPPGLKSCVTRTFFTNQYSLILLFLNYESAHRDTNNHLDNTSYTPERYVSFVDI